MSEAKMLPGALLAPPQVAEILNVPLSWVYSSAENGTLPSFKIGKYRRFSRADIEAWLAQHARGAEATSNGGRA